MLCRVIGSAFALTALPFALQQAVLAQDQPAAKVCFSQPVNVTIRSVTRYGDLDIGSEQQVQLADIALPEQIKWREDAERQLNKLVGQVVQMSASETVNRWNKRTAKITHGQDDISRSLVDAGLALVDSGEAGGLCDKELLNRERIARHNRIGLWSDLKAHPLPADRPADLLQRQGQLTLVTGRIISIGIRQQKTYLNFGRDWQSDFTVLIQSKIWEKIVKGGITADFLKGKTVLLRGVIRSWNGPTLEILAPELLEVVDGVPNRP